MEIASSTSLEMEEELSVDQEQANEIITEALTRAEDIRLQTLREVAQLKEAALQEMNAWWEDRRRADNDVIKQAEENGYQAGWQEGYLQGEQAIRTEMQASIDQANQILDQAFVLKREIVSEAEPFLLEMSIEVARKILQQELNTHPEQVLPLIQEALSRPRDQKVLTLAVHPEQFSFVQSMRADLLKRLDSEAELKIVPDAQIEVGGCYVRSSSGTVDARVSTQLDKILQCLLEMAAKPDEPS
jgi:flagellar assembly protein FliH